MDEVNKAVQEIAAEWLRMPCMLNDVVNGRGTIQTNSNGQLLIFKSMTSARAVVCDEIGERIVKIALGKATLSCRGRAMDGLGESVFSRDNLAGCMRRHRLPNHLGRTSVVCEE